MYCNYSDHESGNQSGILDHGQGRQCRILIIGLEIAGVGNCLARLSVDKLEKQNKINYCFVCAVKTK